jgi:hypothetical protein
MAEPSSAVWLRCSACKRDIPFGKTHWVCSVSTCNRSRTRLVFCSVACWDSHVAILRHRDAWAVEARAPSRDEWAKVQADEIVMAPAPAPPITAAPRRVVAPPPVAPATSGSATSAPATSAPATSAPALADGYDRDMLIVVSKLKKYIKDRSGMNTSDAVGEVLSDHVRLLCDDAIRAAGTDGRKTVLERDVPRPRR